MQPLLLLTLDFPPERGGVARYYDGFIRSLPSGSAAVLTVSHPLSTTFDATREYRIFRRSLLLRQGWPKWCLVWLQALLVRRQFRYETILVGNVLPLGYAALLLRIFAAIPYDLCVHGLDLLSARQSFWKRGMSRLVIHGARRVIANSRYTADLVGRTSTVIYPCPTLPRATADDIVRFKERWNLGGKQVVLSVSRLVRRKGHDMALTALVEIRKSCPDAHFVIVGEGPDRDRLHNLAATLGLSSSVTFTGALPDSELAAAFGAALIFLLPTRTEGHDVEGFGMVFLEAAAAGVPAIGGEGGGVGEAIVDGTTGYLVNPRDPPAIAAAVIRLLGDDALRRHFGEAGRRRVANEFQWEKQILCLR